MLKYVIAFLSLCSVAQAETMFKWGLEDQTEQSEIRWEAGGGAHIGDVIYVNRRTSFKNIERIKQTALFVIQTAYGQVNVYILPRKDEETDRFWVVAPEGVNVEPEVIESKEGEDSVISLWLPIS